MDPILHYIEKQGFLDDEKDISKGTILEKIIF